MLAVEFNNSALMNKVVQTGMKEGFLTDWFLFCDTAIRISPPMNITSDEIEEVCSILDFSISKANSQ